jgi:hypothetical protein
VPCFVRAGTAAAEGQDGRNHHHHAHDDSHGGCGRAVIVAGRDGNEVRFGGSGCGGRRRGRAHGAARVRPSRGRLRRSRPATHKKKKTKREEKKDGQAAAALGEFIRVQRAAACFASGDDEEVARRRSGFDGRRCLPVVVVI